MSVTTIQIDPRLPINEVVRRYPATIRVFLRAGLDACCGGGLPVVEAAARHQVDLGALIDELARAADSANAAR